MEVEVRCLQKKHVSRRVVGEELCCELMFGSWGVKRFINCQCCPQKRYIKTTYSAKKATSVFYKLMAHLIPLPLT